MKCKALRCIYYNEGNGYTVASYVTEEALPEKVSTQKNSQYGMFTAVGNELPTEDGLEVETKRNLERWKVWDAVQSIFFSGGTSHKHRRD